LSICLSTCDVIKNRILLAEIQSIIFFHDNFIVDVSMRTMNFNLYTFFCVRTRKIRSLEINHLFYFVYISDKTHRIERPTFDNKILLDECPTENNSQRPYAREIRSSMENIKLLELDLRRIKLSQALKSVI